MAQKKQGKYRFNDFEVDLALRSLRRRGHPVTVSDRTFDLLVLLMLNAPRTISKEELMAALWPNAEAEQSNLGQHIFLLRQALSGKEPGEKLVVSVPGRGYQFAVNVLSLESEEAAAGPRLLPRHPDEASLLQAAARGQSGRPAARKEKSFRTEVEDRDAQDRDAQDHEAEDRHRLRPNAGASLVAASDVAAFGAFDPSPDPAAEEPPRRQPRTGWSRLHLLARLRGPWRIAALILVILLLSGLGGWFGWRLLHRSPRESLSIMVGDFQDTTGNPQFDQALRTALAIDLRQSPFLEVASRDRISKTVAGMMGASTADDSKAGSASLTPALIGNVARQACQRLGSEVYLTGDIRPLVMKYMVSVAAFNCATGASVASSKGIAGSPDAVLAVLDRLAASLRSQLGESGSSIARFDKPLLMGRPNSFEALQAYSNASHLALEQDLQDAIPLFERALQLDPQFTMAFADLGAVYNNLGERALAVQNLSKAYSLRDAVDEPDKLFITAAYNDIVTRDLQASLRNDKEWAEEYPHDPAPLAHKADLEMQIGKADLALEPARQALTLNPGEGSYYVTLARAEMRLGQFEEAAKTCRLAISRHFDLEHIHGILMQIAFLRLDQPAIDEQVAWAKGKPAEPYIAQQLAMMDFALGKVKAGRAIVQKLILNYRTQGLSEQADLLQGELPRMQAELGLLQTAKDALAVIPEENAASDLPIAWAEVGEITKARAMLQRQIEDHPSDTLWLHYVAPEIKAAIELTEHHPDAAIEALAPASPYDLRLFDVPSLRGLAYLAANKPAEAETEFHKILDHPGVEPYSYNYPLAQLGVARALTQQGKLVEAGYAYKVVRQIWKDADADLPRLHEAKAEAAKINSALNTRPIAAARPRPKITR